MKKLFLFFLLIGLSQGVLAQELKLKKPRRKTLSQGSYPRFGDTGPTVIDKRPDPPITAYKIISMEGDTIHVDTSLTIYKDYRFNYLRKDNFTLLPFSNIGQPYQKLAYDFSELKLIPDLGARAKQYPFLSAEEIYYYHVPTPFTELFFKTTIKQGQLLDAFFSSNVSPSLNIFIGYKGLRSKGRYQNFLTSQGSFRLGFSYGKQGDRYLLKTHFISQDLHYRENGGLTGKAQQNYRKNTGQFKNRSLLAVKYDNAKSLFLGRRFFLQHSYKIIQDKDSILRNQLKLTHRLNFTDKEYSFVQNSAYPGYGKSYETSDLNNLTEYQTVSNTLKLNYTNNYLGNIGFKIRHTHYNYGYNSKIILENQVISNRLNGSILSVGAEYQKKISGFQLTGDAMINLSEEYPGNYLHAKAEYELDSTRGAYADLKINSHQPNFNFLLFQNNYINYNWRNNFDNIQKQVLSFGIHSPETGKISASFAQINNYTYFSLVDNPNNSEELKKIVQPLQDGGSVSYFKIKAHKKFDFGEHFHLDNTILYQNVIAGQNVLRVPDFVTRQALFFDDFWFSKALYLQTGFMFKYFTSFKANAYNPVLGEFYVQNKENLDGFYSLDFFFNGKVDTARIFFKLENFMTLFRGNDNYSALGYPTRDFTLRFGIVWNFFL